MESMIQSLLSVLVSVLSSVLYDVYGGQWRMSDFGVWVAFYSNCFVIWKKQNVSNLIRGRLNPEMSTNQPTVWQIHVQWLAKVFSHPGNDQIWEINDSEHRFFLSVTVGSVVRKWQLHHTTQGPTGQGAILMFFFFKHLVIIHFDNLL